MASRNNTAHRFNRLEAPLTQVELITITVAMGSRLMCLISDCIAGEVCFNGVRVPVDSFEDLLRAHLLRMPQTSETLEL